MRISIKAQHGQLEIKPPGEQLPYSPGLVLGEEGGGARMSTWVVLVCVAGSPLPMFSGCYLRVGFTDDAHLAPLLRDDPRYQLRSRP